jgi:uncharacterized phage protein (TIGR02218 family)
MSGLYDHLATGVTTVCRAWLVVRRDGAAYGFTDHDTDLSFNGHLFKASAGLTARVLQQTTGLSVDNSEALGALSDASVTEADILAGRFDGADIRCWIVNWADPEQRVEQFRGTFGEITRASGQFRAELRGQTEPLNQPQGRIYQRACSAFLGDKACGFDLIQPGFSVAAPVVAAAGGVVRVPALPSFVRDWFQRGKLIVMSGAAAGLVGLIKHDRVDTETRLIELWAGLGVDPVAGDMVRLEAGCDKTAETCRDKFANFLNFRGFPHIPGDDWLASYPVSSQVNDGGSVVR